MEALKIAKTVARYYNLTLEDLCARKRTQEVAHARHVAMYFVKRFAGYSNNKIARLFHRADHTSVIRALQSLRKWQSRKPKESQIELNDVSALIQFNTLDNALERAFMEGAKAAMQYNHQSDYKSYISHKFQNFKLQFSNL
jgi:hypothetical protein